MSKHDDYKPVKELILIKEGELFKHDGVNEQIYVNTTYNVMFDNVNIGVIIREVEYNNETGACNPYWKIKKDNTIANKKLISDIVGKRFTNRYDAANYILETYHQREFEKLLNEPDMILG